MDRKLLCLAVLLAILLVGCQSDVPDTPAASLAASPSEIPSIHDGVAESEVTDSYAVPDTIDARYVQRVLQTLYDVEGDAGRLIVAEERVSGDATRILAAVYDLQQLEVRLNAYNSQLVEGLDATLVPPGNVEVRVDRVISSNADCIYAAGLRDYSAVVRDPRPRQGEVDFFQLLRKQESQDPDQKNPTPWVIGGSVIRDDGSQPANPCDQ